MPARDESFSDHDHPADPYPGSTPGCSFVHLDGLGRPLRRDPAARSGWRVGAGPDLDDWLAARSAAPLAGRRPVLAYGSNRCPAKITWLRAEFGLPGPVVALAVRTEGIAAVWAAGTRARDGQRPATLAAAPGVVERHALWLATPDQLAALDRCEGRGERYRLARLRSGTVRPAAGGPPVAPLCYLALAPARHPLLVDGAPVRCADVGQAAARRLTGAPAATDGLRADPVDQRDRPPSADLTGISAFQDGVSG